MTTGIENDPHLEIILQIMISKLLEGQNLHFMSLKDLRSKLAKHIQVNEERLTSPNIEEIINIITSKFISSNCTQHTFSFTILIYLFQRKNNQDGGGEGRLRDQNIRESDLCAAQGTGEKS